MSAGFFLVLLVDRERLRPPVGSPRQALAAEAHKVARAADLALPPALEPVVMRYLRNRWAVGIPLGVAVSALLDGRRTGATERRTLADRGVARAGGRPGTLCRARGLPLADRAVARPWGDPPCAPPAPHTARRDHPKRALGVGSHRAPQPV